MFRQFVKAVCLYSNHYSLIGKLFVDATKTSVVSYARILALHASVASFLNLNLGSPNIRMIRRPIL